MNTSYSIMKKTSREIYEYIVSEYIDLFENLKKKLNEEIL